MHANQADRRPSRAEQCFREAFDRLKSDAPAILPKGTAISQNNVAKEAGVDPSALRKSRFPKLVAEIQCWIAEHEAFRKAAQPPAFAGRQRARTLREKLHSLQQQRDRLAGLLSEADAAILELTIENRRLKALVSSGTISPLRRTRQD